MGKFSPTLTMENDSLESLSAFLEEPIFLLEEDQKRLAVALDVSGGNEVLPAEEQQVAFSSSDNSAKVF
jgi:hypothetical protein